VWQARVIERAEVILDKGIGGRRYANLIAVIDLKDSRPSADPEDCEGLDPAWIKAGS
jgi:hypothetical protein